MQRPRLAVTLAVCFIAGPVLCSPRRSGRNGGGRSVPVRTSGGQTGPVALALAAAVAGFTLGERSHQPPMPCQMSEVCIQQRQLEEASIFGHIFQQQRTLGLASYHFVSPESSYISYAAAPSSWKLADGGAPPARTPRC